MSTDKLFDSAAADRHEQKYGEDPNLVKREEDQRKSIQGDVKAMVDDTLNRAIKITHSTGKNNIQVYRKHDDDFKDGIHMAKSLISVMFLYDWYGGKVQIEGNDKPMRNHFKTGDGSWKYTLTEDHWCEVIYE